MKNEIIERLLVEGKITLEEAKILMQDENKYEYPIIGVSYGVTNCTGNSSEGYTINIS